MQEVDVVSVCVCVYVYQKNLILYKFTLIVLCRWVLLV